MNNYTEVKKIQEQVDKFLTIKSDWIAKARKECLVEKAVIIADIFGQLPNHNCNREYVEGNLKIIMLRDNHLNHVIVHIDDNIVLEANAERFSPRFSPVIDILSIRLNGNWPEKIDELAWKAEAIKEKMMLAKDQAYLELLKQQFQLDRTYDFKKGAKS